jgi:hypothetical protein
VESNPARVHSPACRRRRWATMQRQSPNLQRSTTNRSPTACYDGTTGRLPHTAKP